MAGPTNHGPSFTEQPRQPTAGAQQHNRPEESGMLGAAASTVKEKAQNLASGAADMAGQVRDTARDWAQSVSSGAQHAWESTRSGASELASNLSDRASDAWDDVGNMIRRNPVPAMLIALGVGFLLGGALGSMTHRRSDW